MSPMPGRGPVAQVEACRQRLEGDDVLKGQDGDQWSNLNVQAYEHLLVNPPNANLIIS